MKQKRLSKMNQEDKRMKNTEEMVKQTNIEGMVIGIPEEERGEE
jgi:RNase H-fold protein (predicted Holliday junction resolvase)